MESAPRCHCANLWARGRGRPGRDAADPLETVPLSTLHVTSAATKRLYYRSRFDMAWRTLDVGAIDFSPGAAKQSVVVAKGRFGAIDVTHALR